VLCVSYRREKHVTDDNDPVSRINWTAVPFPSDRLTLGGVRKLAKGNPSVGAAMIHDLVTHECDVATSAAALALKPLGSRGRRFSASVLEQESRDLSSRYVDLGLAGGIHEAARLVSGLIASAEEAVHRGDSSRPR
jgi:hypothetical protein